MNSQLYTAASGLIVEQRRLDVIGHNLANLASSGHRPQRLFSTTFKGVVGDAPEAVQAANTAVAVGGAYENPERGQVRPTRRALDVALEKGTFLTVETPAGPRYTRHGSLHRSGEGFLVDVRGRRLVDVKGKPVKKLGPEASITADGRVMNAGAEVARLRVVRDPRGVLRREGDGVYTAGTQNAALEKVEKPVLEPGWLEGSGVQALSELVSLIEAQRAFEGYQRVISMTMNEVNRRAVNDLAG